jgi:hypothetical protein
MKSRAHLKPEWIALRMWNEELKINSAFTVDYRQFSSQQHCLKLAKVATYV